METDKKETSSEPSKDRSMWVSDKKCPHCGYEMSTDGKDHWCQDMNCIFWEEEG